ncbi:MAG: HAMP domain-containing histidine kinase [Clostridiales bacterium]|jgi:two-component system sensor histidine kinase VanS|nr:HAMP domain-containing histidine kinase [Clostridiales bacterium]
MMEKMRKIRLGIFGKIFLYTLCLLAFVIGTLAMFFRGQVIVILDETKALPAIYDSSPAAAAAANETAENPARDAVEIYTDFTRNTIIALAILLPVSAIGAALFARSMANPIKKLAADTTKMSKLQFVSAPAKRADEIGQLSDDVHKMYEALKLKIEREKEMEENQRYFFSAVSHELKTPIAAVGSILEGMLANVIRPTEYPEYLKKCLNMMNTQSKLISEILEIIRLDDNRIAPKNEAVRLKSAVEAILPPYQTLADARAQTISVSIPETQTCVLDRNMFCRALSNVLMNAVQNTPGQGEIRIWSEAPGGRTVRLNILNTNAHIDESDLPKLYEPFYRVDKARSRAQNRSGLGLTIVKKTLDCMAIPFSLENRGGDVVFWLDLPARPL